MGSGTFPAGGDEAGGSNAKTAYPAMRMPRVRPRIVDFEKDLIFIG